MKKYFTLKTVNYCFIFTLIFLVVYNSVFGVQKYQKENTSFSKSQKVSEKRYAV